MSAVDEIIGYKRTPDEDFYALLNCDEHSSVSVLMLKCIFSHCFYFLCFLHSVYVFTATDNE